eukprot:9589855-Heterocapsa_arctica.AAC.1
MPASGKQITKEMLTKALLAAGHVGTYGALMRLRRDDQLDLHEQLVAKSAGGGAAGGGAASSGKPSGERL